MMSLSRRAAMAGITAAAIAPMLPALAHASDMPRVRMVKTNGIQLGVYEAGSGPTVVLLHGFPELAYSWRHQIPALVAAGYRVIAPDLRGYGVSDVPTRVEDYDLAHLLGDVIGLLDTLSIEQAIFMGHDWGGLLAWQLPLFHKERVAGVIGVNTPFIPHWMLWLQPDLTRSLMPQGQPFVPDPRVDPIIQMRKVYSPDMYVLMFEDGDVADRLAARDPHRTFETLMRERTVTPADYEKLPPEFHQMAFFKPLGDPEPAQLPGHAILGPSELDFYASSFQRTGFGPGMNWYRNLSRNWRAGLNVDQVIRVPSLMICASDDVILTPNMAAGMGAYVPDLETRVIADCGHWTPQEKPTELSELAIDWLMRRFPPKAQG